MCLTIFSGYLEHGILVRDLTKLGKRYVKSMQFVLDVISIFPTDIMYAAVGFRPELRFNRILRFGRLLECFDRIISRTNYPNFSRILQLIIFVLVIIHWDACIFFAINILIADTYGIDGWVFNISDPKLSGFSTQYSYSVYWATVTLTTIGDLSPPERDVEYCVVVVNFLVGVLVFATIVGNVGGVITNITANRTDFQRRMDGIKRYMAIRKVGSDLENRVMAWFDYLWSSEQSMDEEHALSVLPDKLRAEIAVKVHLDTLRQVSIFQDCEPGLLMELVVKLRLCIYSPGDYICKKGDIGRELYIVKGGVLHVVDDSGQQVLASLREGSVFGEISLLELPGSKAGNRRTANVKSIGYSDLFVLSKADLWGTLEDYPETQRKLEEMGRRTLLSNNLYDESVAQNAAKKKKTFDQVVGMARQINILRKKVNGISKKIKERNHAKNGLIGEGNGTVSPVSSVSILPGDA